MRRILLVLSIALGGGCAGTTGSAATTPQQEKKPMSRSTPWTFVYGDGSANVYRLSQASAGGSVHFEYDPVTPAMSSTGHYSGGDPKQMEVSSDDARIAELWKRVEALEADPAVRAAERAKRTGKFTLTTPEGTRSFIIEHCPGLTELDELLMSFRR